MTYTTAHSHTGSLTHILMDPRWIRFPCATMGTPRLHFILETICLCICLVTICTRFHIFPQLYVCATFLSFSISCSLSFFIHNIIFALLFFSQLIKPKISYFISLFRQFFCRFSFEYSFILVLIKLCSYF